MPDQIIDTENPYAAPIAEVDPGAATDGQKPLASRGARFVAKVIDGLILASPAILIMFVFRDELEALDAEGDIPTGVINLFIAVGALALIYFVAQTVLLITRGQTVGKIVMGIRVELLDKPVVPGFVNVVLLRSWVWAFIYSIPAVGPIIQLADVGFIFAEDRRCLHDRMANTTVRRVR